jgi:AAA domain
VAPVTTDPIDVVTEALARAGSVLRGTSARCPVLAHGDENPSLSVTVGDDGTVLLNCHGPCSTKDVMDTLGLPMSALFPPREPRDNGTLATYLYETTPPMRVVRTLGKRFYQQHQESNGKWVKGSVPVEDRVLYRRAELLAAVAAGGTVYVVEGEKDVESLRRVGECATTNPMGAGCWLAQYALDFKGDGEVVVVADKDKRGRDHARQVADSLRPVVDDVILCEALEGKDVTDHLLAGHTVDELVTGLGDDEQEDAEDDDELVPIDWNQVHDPKDDHVDGLVIPGRWVAFVAEAKAGKSSLLVSVALELSEGRHPFDKSVSVDSVPVLYLDGEMGETDLRELIEACGYDPVHLSALACLSEPLRLDTEVGADRLLALVDRLGSRVVVFDGLNNFVDPAADENSASTWHPFFQDTVRPLKRRGLAIMSGDNTGKDPAKGARGSSIKFDKADAQFLVTPTENGVKVALKRGRGSAFANVVDLAAEGFDRSRPIRYWWAAPSWPAGTLSAVQVLDALGMTLDLGRRKIRELLRQKADEARAQKLDPGPYQIDTTVLAAAIRFRKANPFRPSPSQAPDTFADTSEEGVADT